LTNNWQPFPKSHFSLRIYGEDRNTDLDELISDIVFFTGTCNTCERCGDDLDCPTNYTDIVVKFRTPCLRLLSNCSWNDAPFECCNLFLPIQTEFGICFSINSAITDPPFGRILLSNRFLGPSQLKFSASEDIQLHVHTP
jgi:acid-sensing ion channel, other